MEYVYAALLLHKAGKPVDENGITSVLKAAGVAVNETRVKALVAALEGVNIEEAISKAAFAAAPAPAAAAAAGAPAAAADEGKDEKKKEEEEATGMEGLGALFG
jgi:large subunit ribosomal protein L12